MKMVIRSEGRRRLCDTESAKLVESRSFGAYGDPYGYEERLYRNRRGFFFVWGVGGPSSIYPKETIRAVSGDDGWQAFSA